MTFTVNWSYTQRVCIANIKDNLSNYFHNRVIRHLTTHPVHSKQMYDFSLINLKFTQIGCHIDFSLFWYFGLYARYGDACPPSFSSLKFSARMYLLDSDSLILY